MKENSILNKEPLECIESYKYLGIHFAASGSFTLAQHKLYKKALKALFRLHKYFLSFNLNVSTALHVFEHTIKPILPYGCEIWESFNTSTARFRNGPTALDEMYSKSLCEKLHVHYKFCRFLLKNLNISLDSLL